MAQDRLFVPCSLFRVTKTKTDTGHEQAMNTPSSSAPGRQGGLKRKAWSTRDAPEREPERQRAGRAWEPGFRGRPCAMAHTEAFTSLRR